MADEKNIAPEAFPAWEGPAVGLLDLDAFFASVEQLDHPEWRGRPVIVGGSPEERGVVSTASYEARTFGVHSAMPAATARRLCPNAIWTHGHFDRYRQMSDAVMAIIGDETPYVEQVSIDEAFFDVTPGRFSRESPIAICQRIQTRVAELGVTCSIGLGTTKTVAKIASERDKPRGLTVVLPGTERSFLAPLPVRKMSGIGASTEARLRGLGIHTLGQLAEADPDELEAHLGVMGPRLAIRAAGLEQAVVRAAADEDEVKSVSNERTFPADVSDAEDLDATIMHIAASVGRRLRKKGLAGSVVTLKLKFDATSSHTAQQQLAFPTDDERTFGPVAQQLLRRIWHEGMPVRLVGVGVSGFGEAAPVQLSLFDDAEKDQPAADGALSAAADQVRERFGADALQFGYDLRYRDLGVRPRPGKD